MPKFTKEWGAGHPPVWTQLLGHHKDEPNVHFLEIGSFEGRSALWFLENILTNDSSTLTCVDTWQDTIYGVMRLIEHRFDSNLEPHRARLQKYKKSSVLALSSMMQQQLSYFDFVYIDGSHYSPDVLQDAVLSFELLKPGGLMMFDDYLWKHPKVKIGPKEAIDAFVSIYRLELSVLSDLNRDGIVVVRKNQRSAT